MQKPPSFSIGDIVWYHYDGPKLLEGIIVFSFIDPTYPQIGKQYVIRTIWTIPITSASVWNRSTILLSTSTKFGEGLWRNDHDTRPLMI